MFDVGDCPPLLTLSRVNALLTTRSETKRWSTSYDITDSFADYLHGCAIFAILSCSIDIKIAINNKTLT